MPTEILVGKEVKEVELLDLFPSTEGSIDQVYGRIGNGKTYNTTADIFDNLLEGKVVYANWRINYHGTDERYNLSRIFWNLFLFQKRYYFFPKENLHYFEIDDEWAQKQGYGDFMDWFESRTDCIIYLDEGHVLFDSYQMAKFSMRKRKAILHTRHFNRTMVIISQRPTAIHVSARANVNRFFKCEKLASWPWLIFRRTEFQDLEGETVDETKPLSSKWYFANKFILNSYNSKYLRGGIPSSQKVHFKAYDVTWGQSLKLFFSAVLVGLGLSPRPTAEKNFGEIEEKNQIESPRVKDVEVVSEDPTLEIPF